MQSLDADRDAATIARGKIERSYLQPGAEIVATEQKRAVIAQPSGFGAKKAPVPSSKVAAKKKVSEKTSKTTNAGANKAQDLIGSWMTWSDKIEAWQIEKFGEMAIRPTTADRA